MICNRTELLVDIHIYMRIRVCFAAGESFFYDFPGWYPRLQMEPPLKARVRTNAFAARLTEAPEGRPPKVSPVQKGWVHSMATTRAVGATLPLASCAAHSWHGRSRACGMRISGGYAAPSA